MAIQDAQIQYSVGIEDLYICMMTTENAGAVPTYDTNIYKQTNITDLTISTTSTNFTKWASNKKIINITKNSSFSLAFNLAGLNREVKDKIFKKTRKNGVSFEKSDVVEYPKFAIGVIFPLSDGKKLLRWYPKCTIAPAEETWATQNDEMTVNDIAYTITADPLLFNNVAVTELDTGTAVAGPDNDTILTEQQFMAQVVCDESQLATITAP